MKPSFPGFAAVFSLLFALGPVACGAPEGEETTETDGAIVSDDTTAAAGAAQTLNDLIGSDDGAARVGGEIATLQANGRTFRVLGIRPKNADLYSAVSVTTFAVVYDDGVFLYQSDGGVAWLAPSGDEAAAAAANDFAKSLRTLDSPLHISMVPPGAEAIAKVLAEMLAKAFVGATKAAGERLATMLKQSADPHSYLSFRLRESEGSSVEALQQTLRRLFAEREGTSVPLHAITTRIVGTPQDISLARGAIDALAGIVKNDVNVGKAAADAVASAPARIWVRMKTTFRPAEGTIELSDRSRLGMDLWASRQNTPQSMTLMTSTPGFLRGVMAMLQKPFIKADRMLFQSADDVSGMAERLGKEAFGRAYESERAALTSGGVTAEARVSAADHILFTEFDGAMIKPLNAPARASDDVLVAVQAVAEKTHNGSGPVVTVVVHQGQRADDIMQPLHVAMREYIRTHGFDGHPVTDEQSRIRIATDLLNRGVRLIASFQL
jgi:hypothetical protein